MRVNDLVFGVALLALGAVVAVVAQGFPPVPGQPYGAALFPSLIGVALGVCGLAFLASGRRELRRGAAWFSPPPWVRSRRTAAAVALTFGGLLLCALWARQLGFGLCILALTWPLQRCLGARGGAALVVSCATAAVVEVGFVWVLGAPLPRGVVESLFR